MVLEVGDGRLEVGFRVEWEIGEVAEKSGAVILNVGESLLEIELWWL